MKKLDARIQRLLRRSNEAADYAAQCFERGEWELAVIFAESADNLAELADLHQWLKTL